MRGSKSLLFVLVAAWSAMACAVTAEPMPETIETSLQPLVVGQAVRLTAGASEAVTFDVPADALSVTVSVSGLATETYSISDWRQANGIRLVDVDWATHPTENCWHCANRVLANTGAVAAMAPNGPSVILRPGRHSVVIRGFAFDPHGSVPSEAIVRVDVTAKVGPAPAKVVTLNLNLHFTGAGGLSAVGAELDENFQHMLKSVSAAYRAAGVDFFDVHYVDMSPDFAALETPAEWMQMLAAPRDAEAEPDAVDVFFCDSLFVGVRGMATIPGPLGSDTFQSGVTIALGEVTGDDDLALVVAHELGHYLGLFHTHDVDGDDTFFDALSDTSDARPNVMNSDHRALIFTKQQGEQLRLSPLVH